MKSVTSKLALLAIMALTMLGSSPNNSGDPTNYHRFDYPFYANPVSITYDPGMIVRSPGHLTDVNIRATYKEIRRRPTAVLINALLEAKERLQLNDYLFYKLARNSLKVVYSEQPNSRNAQEITLYSMLIDVGFDARLTYRGNQVFVNVYTNDDLFEVPIIDAGGRPYANISCLEGNCDGRQRLYILRDQPNPGGRSFSFQLRQWPTLNAQPTLRQMAFNFHGREKRMQVTFDQTMIDIMADYPFISEYCYLETPLSPTLRKSLLPQLQRLLEPLTQQQQLELLASFTRSAFNYKEDNEYFGHSKPMVPEELFGYHFSDCEDRSALFFALVRDLLNLPMAVVAYDDHLTIAVGSARIPGDSFTYNDQRYVFCDPTGPRNSSVIGRIPPGYENKNFQIIGTYK
ncbi:MAG: hypothetical protein AAF597_07830 [Bacteroidota bacterium]